MQLPLDLIEYGSRDRLQDIGAGLANRLMRSTPSAATPVTRDDRPVQAMSKPWSLAGEQTFRNEHSKLDVRDHMVLGDQIRMLAIDNIPFVCTAMLWPDVTANFPGMNHRLLGQQTTGYLDRRRDRFVTEWANAHRCGLSPPPCGRDDQDGPIGHAGDPG